MKFTLSWLKEYLDTSASLEEICNQLTNIGLEVESIEDKAKNLENFKVAQIVEAIPVENSKKLKICQVKTINSEKLLQVICGASNARSGLKIAFAPINSVIPSNGMVIKKANLAGFESNGMICSAKELLIGNDDNGVIEIDETHEIGTKISEIYGINDAVIEINITPNRGDCLGIYGIARDLSASNFGTLNKVKVNEIKGEFPFPIEVINKAPNSCKKIAFCVIRNVKNQESPNWLKQKLQAVGVNPISAIVDIVNYVMIDLNRPMHAYDFNKIEGNIIVDFAKSGEKFISLKDVEYNLDDKILTIKDDKKSVGIAGIIGGKNSSCDIKTQDVLLESAFFEAENIAYSGRKLNILSDARYRFERGIDENSCLVGIELATKLILEICGGVVSEVKIIGENRVQKEIIFNINKIEKLTGIFIEKPQIIEILTKLEFICENKSLDEIKIICPTHRHDINCSQDIVEEVIRIYGYDKIVSEIPTSFNFAEIAKSENIEFSILKKLRKFLINKGLFETINWSFIDQKNLDDFGYKTNQNLILKNPISIELNYMRPSLVFGLIDSYKKNSLRNFDNLSLFEIGNIFENDKQSLSIAGLRVGKNLNYSHYHDNRDFDIFDVKKDLFDVVKTFGVNIESLQILTDNPPKYFHPERFAKVVLGKNIVGYFGEINPKISKKFTIKNRVNFFEVFTNNLPIKIKKKNNKRFTINDLPIVERDFAFLIDKEIAVGAIILAIKSIDKQMIKDVDIFDIFSGNNIDENKKSVALRVKIEPLEKTLTSKEIDEVSQKIITKITTEFSATLRNG